MRCCILSLMYQLFWPIFQNRLPIRNMLRHVHYRAAIKARSAARSGTRASRDYVAMRFYFRPSFPDTEANRNFVWQGGQARLGRVPLVLLNTGLSIDDHIDCPARCVDNA